MNSTILNQEEPYRRDLWLRLLFAKLSFRAFILFLVITVVSSLPLLLKLDRVLIGEDNDVYINTWADWWTAKALSDPSIELYSTDYLFYPQGVDLTYHSFSHWNTAVSLLLQPLFGPIAAYNLAILVNYVLNSLAMYHFARYWTQSHNAALLAGIVFAFNSHSLYQSSHPVLVSIWPLGWSALFLLQALRDENKRKAVQAAVFVLLAALASSLMLILLALWLGLLLTYLLVRKEIRRSSWPILAVFVVASLLACLPILFPILRNAFINGDSSYLVDPLTSKTSSLTSIFIPHWYYWDTRSVYFGFVPFSLVWFARYQRDARPWFLLLFLALAFSFGPRPRFGAIELDVVLPWSVPLAPVLRNMYRLSIITSLALAMLVAYGWMTLGRSISKKYRALAYIVLSLLILADYLYLFMPYTPIQISPFYTEYLDAVPDDAAIAIVPIGRQIDKRYLLYQTYHGHRMIGGTVSRPEPAAFQFIKENALLRAGVGADDLPRRPLPADLRPSLAALAAENIEYLVIDKTFDLDVEAWREAMPVEPVYEDEFLIAYETEIN